MKKSLKILIVLLFAIVANCTSAEAEQSPFVTARIMGQLGNNLFQVAAASALAWDNDAEPCFPEFDSNDVIYQHLFFRFNNCQPKNHVDFVWNEPFYSYDAIPYYPNMQIFGYFQSEKYFAQYRSRLLELFAPHPDDLAYIKEKYQDILDHPKTVGIQLRYYKWEFPMDDLYPQYGKDYLRKAMALFPKTSLFVVSSNNIEYARKCIPTWAKNVIILENEPNYIDFHILSYCKHNIITNSSFGWWSAWLNQNPDKIIVRPSYWIRDLPAHDVCPEEWISMQSKYE